MDNSLLLKVALLVILLAACGPLGAGRGDDSLLRPAAALPTPPVDAAPPPPIKAARAPDPTRTPAPTEPIAAPEPVAVTDVASAILTRTASDRIASFPSPDGAWRVDVMSTGCVTTALSVDDETVAVEQVLRVGVADDTITAIEHQTRLCAGLGSYGFEGLAWSTNSRYFYYTAAREGSPDGLCWYWERSIARLEVATGRVEQLGGGPFSPDGTRLATWQNRDVVIWDLNLGELTRVPAVSPSTFGGPIAWAPDGAAIVYLENGAGCPPFGTTRLTRVDVAQGRPFAVLDSTTQTFSRVAWPDPGRLELMDEQGAPWTLDLSTRDLTRDLAPEQP